MLRVRRWHSTAAAALCVFAGQSDPVAAMRHTVDALLAEGEVAGPPVDLRLLASLRDVRSIDYRNILEAGRLVPEDTGDIVQVNRRHTEGKRRFTVGHEICHTFFNEAKQSARASVDLTTGLFDIRDEEEYLCDVGAARILLNPCWLVPMAQSRPASLDGLFEIADVCGASIEATAFQLAQSAVWQCTFVFWEQGLRKAQQLPPGQAALPGLKGMPDPGKKLRVTRAYGSDYLPFVPRNKSVEQDSTIHQALVARGRTEGREVLYLGSRPLEAYCQSDYAPYYDGDGSLVQRVVSCVVWRQEEKAKVMPQIPGLWRVSP